MQAGKQQRAPAVSQSNAGLSGGVSEMSVTEIEILPSCRASPILCLLQSSSSSSS